jgi:DNA-binding MarR family transcriptional regulator
MAQAHELAMALRSGYWTLHRETNASLARHGTTADQYVLLSLLMEQDGVTQQELVRRASSDANTIRQMLLLLESAGLIERRPHARDGRAQSVTLTRKGRRKFTQLRSATEACRQRLVRCVGRRNVGATIRALQRISLHLATSRKKSFSQRSGTQGSK